jgi:hypothetical protein
MGWCEGRRRNVEGSWEEVLVVEVEWEMAQVRSEKLLAIEQKPVQK